LAFEAGTDEPAATYSGGTETRFITAATAPTLSTPDLPDFVSDLGEQRVAARAPMIWYRPAFCMG
jgi:hypothetical protein